MHSTNTHQTMAAEGDDRAAGLQQEEFVLESDEVRELWSFVHGDIMMGGLRQQLLFYLGLCNRHTWGHAVVEIELWQYGPGNTGGHQPFDVAVLYTDLLSEVSRQLAKYHPSRRHHAEDVLGRHGTCRICSEIAGDTTNVIGYAAQDTAPLVAEANRMTHTRTRIVESQGLWRPQACPTCRGTDPQPGHPVAEPALLCRRHLLEQHHLDLDSATAHAYAAHLTQLATRLNRHLRSMTDSGFTSTADDQTAWIETLGWFAGWTLPLALVSADVGTPPAENSRTASEPEASRTSHVNRDVAPLPPTDHHPR
jgi:hypothetical protein